MIREQEEEARMLRERCEALEKYSDDLLKVTNKTSGSKSARQHSSVKERGDYCYPAENSVTFYRPQSGAKPSQSGVESRQQKESILGDIHNMIKQYRDERRLALK